MYIYIYIWFIVYIDIHIHIPDISGVYQPRLPPKPSEIIRCSNPNTARNRICVAKLQHISIYMYI